MHGHCKKGQRNMVAAALREVFNAEDLADAKERSASVIERLSGSVPKVATLLAEAEEDLLAFYRFPGAHWPKLRSTNNIERVNKEIARRSDVVGIFPNDSSVIRLVGALLIEQNDCVSGWGCRPHGRRGSPAFGGLTRRNECPRGFLPAPAGAGRNRPGGLHSTRRPPGAGGPAIVTS